MSTDMTVGDAVARMTQQAEDWERMATNALTESGKLFSEQSARAIRVVLAALAASAKDSERVDWLDADAERVESVFGACVRHEEGGILRAIIDAARETA